MAKNCPHKKLKHRQTYIVTHTTAIYSWYGVCELLRFFLIKVCVYVINSHVQNLSCTAEFWHVLTQI